MTRAFIYGGEGDPVSILRNEDANRERGIDISYTLRVTDRRGNVHDRDDISLTGLRALHIAITQELARPAINAEMYKKHSATRRGRQ